jgi:hypothetical protein
LSYSLRATPPRRAEPVDDPVIDRHLDDPPANAVAADDAAGLQHPAQRELSGASEIDDGLAVHCWSFRLIGSAD